MSDEQLKHELALAFAQAAIIHESSISIARAKESGRLGDRVLSEIGMQEALRLAYLYRRAREDYEENGIDG